jgi:formiminotetrahydrofolate cyclodeaminase
MAAALLSMVGELSVKRPELAAKADKFREVIAETTDIREKLTKLVDKDSEAFFEVMDAFKLPKGSDEEKKVRSAAIQKGYKSAVNLPLGTSKLCLRAAQIGLDILKMGYNTNTASDLGVGLECARTGFNGAMMNVSINLPSIKDESYLALIRSQQSQMRDDLNKTLNESYELLSQNIQGLQ